MKSAFLCHSSQDKSFVRKLAGTLRNFNVRVWIDEAEIKIGDTLYSRIDGALNEMDYFIVVYSANSVSSRWVQVELELALQRQLAESRVFVLPVLIEDVADLIPPSIRGILYAHFNESEPFNFTVLKLLRAMEVVKPFVKLINGSLISEREAQKRYSFSAKSMKESRNLLTILASYPQMDLPENQKWFLRELTRKIYAADYKVEIVVGRFKDSTRNLLEFRIWDQLFGYNAQVMLTDDQFRRGVWEFEFDMFEDDEVRSPEPYQLPIATPREFISSVGLTIQQKEAFPESLESAKVMRPILNCFLQQVPLTDGRTVTNFLFDLTRIVLLNNGRRKLRFRTGNIHFAQCATYRPNEGNTTHPILCSRNRDDTLYFEFYDSFFNSSNSIFLCGEHLETLWDAEANLFNQVYNLPVIGVH